MPRRPGTKLTRTLGLHGAALATALALTSCDSGGGHAGHPGPCDATGAVIARAETLHAIKDALLERRAEIGAARVVAHDVDDDLPLFDIEDERGRAVDAVLIWRQKSGVWVSAQFRPCQ